MLEKLYYDKITNKLQQVERLPLIEHTFQPTQNLPIDILRRISELEKRGA